MVLVVYRFLNARATYYFVGGWIFFTAARTFEPFRDFRAKGNCNRGLDRENIETTISNMGLAIEHCHLLSSNSPSMVVAVHSGNF